MVARGKKTFVVKFSVNLPLHYDAGTMEYMLKEQLAKEHGGIYSIEIEEVKA